MNAVAAIPLASADGAPTNPRFVDNADGTITDTTTSLTWSKATLTTKEVNHAAAEQTCSDLDLAGHTDWRLPTVEELFALADRSKVRPAIDTDAFPDTKSDWYWSSTVHASVSSYAWVVGFDNGNAYGSRRGNGLAFVRAVRASPAGQ